MIYSLLYLISMVAVNIGFAYVPIVLTPLGAWPPMALAVGLVFVLRDFAQREIGHKVLGLMLLGAVLSYFMASPAIALASCVAYLVGEGFEWLAFTFTRREFKDRMALSCLIGTPLDSAVFLLMIGVFSVESLLLMVFSKMVAAAVTYAYLRKQS